MRAPTLNLALQGGGAHGAFTWGVLDALLASGRVDIGALSGTSAGAMNAVVLAQGWMDGGRDGARAALDTFWASLAGTLPLEATHAGADGGAPLAPLLKVWMMWARYVTPAQFNPLNVNPVRELLVRQVDFERLRRDSPFPLAIAATQADSGRLRLFTERDLGVDALLASACLPTIFHAPHIEGHDYWDGGYAANPAVFPLLGPGRAPDTLLVLLLPLAFAPLPAGARAEEIHARVAEIAFTAAFRREMQALLRERDLARDAWWPLRRLAAPSARARLHLIDGGAALAHLAGESRLAVGLKFFHALRDIGREAAARWLAAHGDDVGRREGVDLAALFA